jgi:hypothetical protein
LAHNAVLAPGSKRVVESLVCCSHGLLARERHSGVVETREIAHAEISGRWHYPRVAAIAQDMAETVVILEHEIRVNAESGIHRRPIDRVGKIDVEIGHKRLPLPHHVGGGREISLLQVLQLCDQCLLRRATGAGFVGNGSLVDHDRKREARVTFRRRHHHLRGLIREAAWPIPIDDHAVDAAADHVVNLILYLDWIRGIVAHIHVVAVAEPEHQMRVNLGRGSGIKQRMHVDLADVARAQISIRLGSKGVRCAGVVRGLGGEGCGWCDIV